MTTDNKVYILKKSIESPQGCVAAGTKSIFNGGFYCFPYIGRNYNDDKNGWLGNSFMLSNPDMYPEWFLPEEKVTGLIGVSIKGNVVDYENSASIKLGEDGKPAAIAIEGKIFLPENKSNDSFQWTDELVLEFANGLRDEREIMAKWHWHKQSVLDFKKAKFKQSHTPKPQAENKSIAPIPLLNEEDEKLRNKYSENKPDWEIECFQGRGKNYWKQKSGRYRCDLYELEIYKGHFLLDCPNEYKIHSVKRLSDGEVFSVGDEDTSVGKIVGFEILPSNMMMVQFKFNGKDLIYPLNQISKSKPQPQKEELTQEGIKTVLQVLEKYGDKEKSKPTEQRIEGKLPIKFSKEVSDFIQTNFSMTSDNWYATHFGYKKVGEDIFEMHPLNKVPDGLKLFTQQQVDAMCEDAFAKGWIARDRNVNRLMRDDLDNYKSKKSNQ